MVGSLDRCRRGNGDRLVDDSFCVRDVCDCGFQIGDRVIGYGDELIGSGFARGAQLRGKRIAFGDGKRIIWREQAHEIYKGNPNVAPPGSEGAADLEWIEYYKGHRLYGDFKAGHWEFNDFRCPPGEMWFDEKELAMARYLVPQGAVVIEPTTKPMGACVGANKQWPQERYSAVAEALAAEGYTPICLGPGLRGFPSIARLSTPTFRDALAILSMSVLYIGPEGGMHHGAAAVDTPAVVIFGGFNSPRSTGYPWHANLTAGGDPCGNVAACKHCREAMASISVDRVVDAALAQCGTAVNRQRKLM